MTAYGRGQRRRYPLVELDQGLVPLAKANPFVILWRWRYEAALLTGAAIGGMALYEAIGLHWALAVVTALPHAVLLWRPARRWLAARMWCIVTPHRVRTAFAHARIHSRTGKIPVVLWTSPQPYGERVTVWCRAGTTAEDLEAERAILRTACLARDVKVVPHPDRADIVDLHVVRRDDHTAPPPWGATG